MDRILYTILANSLRDANRIDDTQGNTTESYRQQMTVLFAAISYTLDLVEAGPYFPPTQAQDAPDGPLTSFAELAEWLRSVEL